MQCLTLCKGTTGEDRNGQSLKTEVNEISLIDEIISLELNLRNVISIIEE